MRKAFPRLIIFSIIIFLLTSCTDFHSSTDQVAPVVIWEKLYSRKGYGHGNYLQRVVDDGYIIVGNTKDKGWDGWLIRIDSSGKELWKRTYGGIFADHMNCVQPTSDGGFIFTGSTMVGTDWNDVYNLAEQAWIVKIDATGNEMWDINYGQKYPDIGHFVLQTKDENYLVLAETAGTSPIRLIKLDSNGNEIWNKTVGQGGLRSIGLSMQQTMDEGYVIIGTVHSKQTRD